MLGKLIGSLLTKFEREAMDQFRHERRVAKLHRRGLAVLDRMRGSLPSKLNLGSGNACKPGYLNVDMLPGCDVTLDIRRLPLPFPDQSFDTIFSEHCLEHIAYPEPISGLSRECFRTLKPGGTLLLSVPDTGWPLREYAIGADGWLSACREHRWHPAWCRTPLEHINYHFRQDGEHQFAYDFETMRLLLQDAGLVDIAERAFDPSIDSEHRRAGSLFVSARRPT